MTTTTQPTATGLTATGRTATGLTATGPTATGPTATGPTATGPTTTGPTATQQATTQQARIQPMSASAGRRNRRVPTRTPGTRRAAPLPRAVATVTPIRSARRRVRLLQLVRAEPDAGMATAEYAIATVAAAGFAGLLLVILRSDEVKGMLLGIVRGALSL